MMPLALGIFMSITMGSMFQSGGEIDVIKVHVVDEDQSPLSKWIDAQLQSDSLKQYLTMTDREEARYIVTIPRGYADDFWKSPQAIHVHAKINTSVIDGSVVKSIVDQITSAIREQLYIDQLLDAAQVSQAEKTTIRQDLARIAQSATVTNQKHKGVGAYSSAEHYSITMVTFILVMMISALLESNIKPELSGFRKRMGVLPISQVELYAVDTIVNTALLAIIGAIYYGVWRIYSPEALQGSVLLYLLVFTLQIVIAYTISHILNTFMGPKGIKLFSSVLSMLFVFFSGMIPFEKMVGEGSPLSALNANSLQAYTTGPYFSIHDGLGFAGIQSTVLTLGIAAVVLFLLGLVVANRKKEITS